MDDRANPYRTLESGTGADSPHDRPKRPKRPWALSVRLLVFGVTTVALSALVVLGLKSAEVESVGPYLVVGLVSAVVVLRIAIRGVIATFRDAGAGSGGALTALSVIGSLAVLLGHLGLALGAGYVALISVLGGARGRQLRRRGRVLLPPVVAQASWAGALDPTPVALGPDAPAGLADEWRENGRTEHASVAAFAHLALDLVALGAPPRLIAMANQDGLDEIRHTEACFALARRLDGRAAGPASFPDARRVPRLPRSRPLALAKLAVDSLVDGALNEGVSARSLARLAERCDAEPIRVVLKQLAADEGRHAAHGWDVVEWCLAEGGWVVESALAGALRALPAGQRSSRPEAAAGGAWERWGIPGHALEQAEYRAARAHLVARLEGLLAEHAVAA